MRLYISAVFQNKCVVCKDGEKLEDFLDNRIFKELSGETIEPAKEEIDGFDAFMDHYKAGLEIEKSAIEHMKW